MAESIYVTLGNWVLVFGGLLFLLFFLVNFFMQGFFVKYFRVKSSRGKKVLVKVETMIDRYLAIGMIQEGFLIYKKRNSKDKARVVVPKGSVYKELGVYAINVDEEKNAVLKTDYTAVSGYDAEKVESLYLRALYKPSLQDNKTKLLILLMIGLYVGLIVVGAIAYQTSQRLSELAVV